MAGKKKSVSFLGSAFFKNGLRYEPNTQLKAEGHCDPNLTNWNLKKAVPYNEAIEKTEKYLDLCEDSIKTGWTDVLSNTYFSMMLKLNPMDYPYGRLVILNLPNNYKVKGFLALKNDGKKRPLVILRTGIFSNATEFLPERFVFFQMFEQSRFNVLVLESNSGQENITRNKIFALGGYEEGLQDYFIARQLRNPKEPFSKFISSLHFVADSFGGHGVMFASILNKYNKNVIDSVLGYCPLIQFEKTFEYHKSTKWISKALNYWVHHRLLGLEEHFSELIENNFFDIFHDYMEKNYQGSKVFDGSFDLPPGMTAHLKNYWKQNDFWSYYHDIQTPTLIFATKTDPLVPYELNSQFLKELKQPNVRIFKLTEGVHCSFPGAYQWKPMAQLAQNFIYSQSPDKWISKGMNVELNDEIQKYIEKNGFHPQLEVVGHLKNHQVQVEVRFTKENSLFFDFENRRVQFPFSSEETGFITDESKNDLMILNRWIHQNFTLTYENKNLKIQWFN